jgi:hypothetical protein
MSQLLLDTIGHLVNALTNLIPAMKTTNQHLGQVVQPAVNITNTPSPTYKPPAPNSYDGNPACVKACLQEHEAYFILTKLTNLQTQIFLTLGNVHRGKDNHTTRWSDSIQDQVMVQPNLVLNATTAQATNPATVIPEERFTTWNAFSAEMTQQFGLLDYQEEAIKAIHLLEQGNMTCEEYVTIFKGHAMQAGYNELAQLFEFK